MKRWSSARGLTPRVLGIAYARATNESVGKAAALFPRDKISNRALFEKRGALLIVGMVRSGWFGLRAFRESCAMLLAPPHSDDLC